MRRYLLFCVMAGLGICIALGCAPSAPAGNGDGNGVPADVANRVFFLHHSVGQGLIDGGVRQWITDYNTAHATSFEFWDHGYPAEGLRNAEGADTGESYGATADNTNPDGLLYLWTSAEAEAVHARQLILDNYYVIAFKSCFVDIVSLDDGTLAQYRTDYLQMRDVFDQHTDRIFVVVTAPPGAYGATDAASASNAREFANWMGSATYLSGHPNVLCFDLFDLLANPDDGTARANMLRDDYLSDPTGQDSHPNEAGNQAVAPLFAEFLVNAATG